MYLIFKLCRLVDEFKIKDASSIFTELHVLLDKEDAYVDQDELTMTQEAPLLVGRDAFTQLHLPYLMTYYLSGVVLSYSDQERGIITSLT